MLKRILFFAAIVCIASSVMAQVTTSNLSGLIKSQTGENLAGASVTITHIPTGTVYTTISRTGGKYDLANINPGGPYKIEVSYVGFNSQVRENVFTSLGETGQQDFTLVSKDGQLTEVVVATTRRPVLEAKGGAETTIGRDKMNSLPTVGRNISDYLRYVPQAKITNDGGISLAGQNNRYNSFYIDGAVNNDVFGLANSGTNGGQAGIAPISIDAIDQFQVILSPFDPSLGNFTGGGINATTKSGTNEFQGSVYYFFRNQDLSGKAVGVPKAQRVKLSDFSNKTYGFRVGGPIIKNKLFFFLSGEIQRDTRPQPFDPTTYAGASTMTQINALASYLQTEYGYDPGGFIDNPEKVEANRVTAKIDWNIGNGHRLSLSYRYNDGFRNNVSRSSNATINFYNNGYAFPSTTHSASAELNSRFSTRANNKLLLTYTGITDDRGAIGTPFPRVTINDGANGRIIFGTEENSTGNLLEQTNIALFDVFKFYVKKHTFTIGTDDEFSKSLNIFIRQNYGSYVFADLNTFTSGGTASTYNRSYSLLDDPSKSGDESINAAAKFNSARLAFFIGDEIKVNDALTLSLGLRADKTMFLTTPKTDRFFNDSALPRIAQYYDLKGARSGQINDPKMSLNPRIGFVYKIRDENLTIRGGFGTFTGRVPLVWPGGVYNNNGISIAGIARSNVAFREDAFGQYTAADFGITVPVPSGQVDLISKDFRLTKVFRLSLGVDKNLGKGWRFTVEGIYTKNINEIDYKKVSILPPNKKSVGVDVRNVYDLSGNFAANIPLRGNGTAPYTGVYVLSNNDGKKGYSYNFTTTIDKQWASGLSFNANYSYGSSIVLNEGTSFQNNSQWRFMETVNGRNFITLSTSDYDPGHRISMAFAKKFSYWGDKMATTISLVYNGQSGNPFSYVLNTGIVRDEDNNESNDLMYVPTQTDLQSMIFLSNTTSSGVTYTPDQQRALFNQYIESDRYLRKNRGRYAERNGARLPFSHIMDLKILQDFNVKIGKKTYQLQVSYDVFNFTNMLNKDWGRLYFITNDQSTTILNMAGFVSPTNLTPQYRFTPPFSGKPWVISDGVYSSARWTSQLGVRLSF